MVPVVTSATLVVTSALLVVTRILDFQAQHKPRGSFGTWRIGKANRLHS